MLARYQNRKTIADKGSSNFSRRSICFKTMLVLTLALCFVWSQAQTSLSYQPSYKTRAPGFVLSSDEAMVIGGQHGIPNDCGSTAYLLFVPWTGDMVIHDSGFAAEVDLDPGQFAAGNFRIENLCQNESGNIVVVLRPHGYDVGYNNQIDLILTYSLQGELLDSETVILTDFSTPTPMDSVCVEIPNLIENVGDGVFKKGTDFIRVGSHADAEMGVVYIDRYSEGNEPDGNPSLSVSNIDLAHFYCYWVGDNFSTGIYGNNSHMLDIDLTITNYGFQEVCSFELNFDRGIVNNNFCGAYLYKHLVVEECIAPGESIVVPIGDWEISSSLDCHEQLCITVFNPNDRKNIHPESTVCEIYNEDDFDCVGLPCWGAGPLGGTPDGLFDEDCECDYNALCTNDIEVSVVIECFEGYNTYEWTISGGAPATDATAYYNVNGMSIYNQQVAFGEPFEQYYGADTPVSIQITDNAGCSLFWQAPEEIDCFSGLDDSLREMQVAVFPNPTQDFLNVELAEFCDVFLYSAQGRLVRSWPNLLGKQQLDLSDCTAGIFYLLIEHEEGRAFKKIMKK